jgi:hypothetical protein
MTVPHRRNERGRVELYRIAAFSFISTFVVLGWARGEMIIERLTNPFESFVLQTAL